MEFTYRMAMSDDYPALVKFWNENAGWDIIDQETWESRFVKTSNGVTQMSIAIDDSTENIVGQIFFIPFKIALQDKEYLGFRPSTFVIGNGVRNQWISKVQEILLHMYLQAVGVLSMQGAHLFFAIPHERWIGLFRNQHTSQESWGGVLNNAFFQQTEFSLYSLKRPIEKSVELPKGFSLIENLKYDDPRIDQLWQKARMQYKAMVSRDSQTLAWKNSHRAYQLRGIEYEGRLIGLFVWIAKPKDKQILICDLMSENTEESLNITLLSTILTANQYIKNEAEDGEKIEKVGVLATEPMKPHLENLGFKKDNYKFPLLIHLLDSTLSIEDIAPTGWYLSAND